MHTVVLSSTSPDMLMFPQFIEYPIQVVELPISVLPLDNPCLETLTSAWESSLSCTTASVGVTVFTIYNYSFLNDLSSRKHSVVLNMT